MRLPLLPAHDIGDDRRELYDGFVANVRENFPDIITMREDGALLGPWGVWIQLLDWIAPAAPAGGTSHRSSISALSGTTRPRRPASPGQHGDGDP